MLQSSSHLLYLISYLLRHLLYHFISISDLTPFPHLHSHLDLFLIFSYSSNHFSILHPLFHILILHLFYRLSISYHPPLYQITHIFYSISPFPCLFPSAPISNSFPLNSSSHSSPFLYSVTPILLFYTIISILSFSSITQFYLFFPYPRPSIFFLSLPIFSPVKLHTCLLFFPSSIFPFFPYFPSPSSSFFFFTLPSPSSPISFSFFSLSTVLFCRQ